MNREYGSEKIKKALLSLDGLSTGDAFGENFFDTRHTSRVLDQELPPGIWQWTDDTAMAICIVQTLAECEVIDQDLLAACFADRFAKEPYRGYGMGAAALLSAISGGRDWRDVAPTLFGGGSYGNGAAMRVAPLGAYYHDDVEAATREARRSAEVTHCHREGIAGAIAVAAAASLAGGGEQLTRNGFLEAVASCVPESDVRQGIEQSAGIDAERTREAALKLGTGAGVSAQDTVPFCIWCAADNLYDYESAMWQTASGFGDVDTTCAIVGGIVALSTGGVPDGFIERREPLPRVSGP